VSKIGIIQSLVRDGLYYLTEHAYDEALADDFDVYDVEHGLLTDELDARGPKTVK
jgi:hypothetical protein